MSHAVKVLQGSLRRLLLIQAALALAAAEGYLLARGLPHSMAALFGGGIALFNSAISALQLARAARVGDATRQMAELYMGAAFRFLATPALVAAGILVLDLDPVAIIVGFAVAQVAYLFGNTRPETPARPEA